LLRTAPLPASHAILLQPGGGRSSISNTLIELNKRVDQPPLRDVALSGDTVPSAHHGVRLARSATRTRQYDCAACEWRTGRSLAAVGTLIIAWRSASHSPNYQMRPRVPARGLALQKREQVYHILYCELRRALGPAIPPPVRDRPGLMKTN
jgi:hypothetical protein